MKRRRVSKTKQRIVIFIVLMLMISVGYASLSSTLRITGKADVKAKSFDVHFDKVEILKGKDSEIEKSRAVIDEEDNTKVNFTINFQSLGDEYEFTVDAVNSGDIDAEVVLVTPINLGEASSYVETKITYIDGSEIKTGDRLNADNSHTYKITVKYREDATNLPETDQEINLSFSVEYQKNNGSGIDPYLRNNNIVTVYYYNEESGENRCINGEEDTCTAIRTSKTTTYNMGTIIKYKVNENEEKYFYVLHDDGDKLTLQQRENIVDNIEWYKAARTAGEGPLTALESLENITENWVNVQNQTYEMGVTDFNGTNSYTHCNYSGECTDNIYVLEQRIAKARMITYQEAISVGCQVNSNQCPVWMSNYLNNSTDYGGTNNNPNVWGYWTMSAHGASAWHIRSNKYMVIYFGDYDYVTATYLGVRPVIEINK